MASITIGGLEITVTNEPTCDGKGQIVIGLHGIISIMDILIYLVIDGIMWLSLYALIIS